MQTSALIYKDSLSFLKYRHLSICRPVDRQMSAVPEALPLSIRSLELFYINLFPLEAHYFFWIKSIKHSV